MTVTITCPECGSAISVCPSIDINKLECNICHCKVSVKFNEDHLVGILNTCVYCHGKVFYSQKDFNRKIGVILFIIAAVLSIWTYGISFIVLYLADLFLFKFLPDIAICYKCHTIFRDANNINEIKPFNHQVNDSITYS